MISPAVRSKLLLSLLIIVVLLGLYWPVMQAVYGAADDFPTFFPVDDHIPRIYRADGRPILELLLYLVSGFIRQLADLRLLRGISVLGIGLLCVALFQATRRLFPRPEYRLAVCISIGALPTLVVFAAWATVWSYSWGAMLAVVAGMICWRGCRLRESNSYRKAIFCWLASTIFLVLIFWTYQPLVSWFWIVGVIAVLDDRFLRNRFYRHECAWFVAAGFVQMATCFVALKAFILLSGVEAKSRVQLLSDPVAKVLALGRTTVTMVLDQWQVVDVDRKPFMLLIAALTALIILAGFIVALARPSIRSRVSVRMRLLWLGAIVCCFALSHVHGLAADVNVKNYRTIGALCVCTTILLTWSLRLITESVFSGERGRLVLRIVAGWLLIVSLGMAQANVVHYWTSPFPRGYAYLVEQLEEKLTPNTRRIHLIRQTVDDGIVTERAMHAFGRPLTEPEWVMPGIVIAALRDIRQEQIDLNLQLEYSDSLSPSDAPEGDDVVVIDMRELTKFRSGYEANSP